MQTKLPSKSSLKTAFLKRNVLISFCGSLFPARCHRRNLYHLRRHRHRPPSGSRQCLPGEPGVRAPDGDHFRDTGLGGGDHGGRGERRHRLPLPVARHPLLSSRVRPVVYVDGHRKLLWPWFHRVLLILLYKVSSGRRDLADLVTRCRRACRPSHLRSRARILFRFQAAGIILHK